jgi:hypothetical protein
MRGYAGDSGSSLLPAAHPVGEGTSWTVECTTLASLQRDYGVSVCAAALVKIDIEGSEAAIGADLATALTLCPQPRIQLPALWLSLHPAMWSPEDRAAMVAALDRLTRLYDVVQDAELRPVPRGVDGAVDVEKLLGQVTVLLAPI